MHPAYAWAKFVVLTLPDRIASLERNNVAEFQENSNSHGFRHELSFFDSPQSVIWDSVMSIDYPLQRLCHLPILSFSAQMALLPGLPVIRVEGFGLR
jgi:hypothetical protein